MRPHDLRLCADMPGTRGEERRQSARLLISRGDPLFHGALTRVLLDTRVSEQRGEGKYAEPALDRTVVQMGAESCACWINETIKNAPKK